MDLVFTLERITGGHGADDYEDDKGKSYTLHASAHGQEIGWLDFNLKRGPSSGATVIWVRWIEVAEALRRKGLGSAILDEARRLFPGADVDTGGFSGDGAEIFWDAWMDSKAPRWQAV